MSGVNKVIILGRLGKDPEIRYTGEGTAVCNFSLATSEQWKDKSTGEKKEKTEWHRVVVFGKVAELCNQYLSKGRQAYVEGRLETRSWDNKEGVKQYTTEIKASSVQFIGGDDKQAPAQKQQTPNMQSFDNVETDSSFAADDIPF